MTACPHDGNPVRCLLCKQEAQGSIDYHITANRPAKRPSTLIRERAEEHARKIGEETGVPVTDYQALLGCQVEAIKAYLDHLAGYPKNNE